MGAVGKEALLLDHRCIEHSYFFSEEVVVRKTIKVS